MDVFDIEKAIVAYLIANSSVTALVNNRIYPVLLPEESTTPAIVYQKINNNIFQTMGSGDSGIYQDGYQFSCFADTYDQSIAIATALHTALTGYSGNMGSIGVNVQQVQFDGFTPLYDNKTKLHNIAADFTFWYGE